MIDAKSPWRSITAVCAEVKCGDKISFIDYYFDGRERRSIVGATAFPYLSGALASQNQRCRDGISRVSKYRSLNFYNLKCAYEMRLEQNLVEKYMNVGDKFRNNDGTISTINAIRGKQIFFSVQTFKDQRDVGQTKVENFKKRFPVKV